MLLNLVDFDEPVSSTFTVEDRCSRFPMLGLFSLFCPEDGSNRFLQNIHNNLPDYMMAQSKRQ
jgi:hypothetical protein